MLKSTLMTICLTLPLTLGHAEDAAKVFTAAGLKTLEIHSESGDLDIEASSSQEVSVTVTKPDAAKCEIVMERRGNVLHLQAKSIGHRFWGSSCRAGFQVRAPKELALDASAGSGEMRISGLEGALALKAGSGDIRIYDVSGKVDARLGSGDIDLSWATSPKTGEVDIKTGSGDVSLVLPQETLLRTNTRTGSGTVINELGETASADLLISVKAGSGDVTIRKARKSTAG
jgi:DUF4097 and DUF4098 domain-containing protein YvlB